MSPKTLHSSQAQLFSCLSPKLLELEAPSDRETEAQEDWINSSCEMKTENSPFRGLSLLPSRAGESQQVGKQNSPSHLKHFGAWQPAFYQLIKTRLFPWPCVPWKIYSKPKSPNLKSCSTPAPPTPSRYNSYTHIKWSGFNKISLIQILSI